MLATPPKLLCMEVHGNSVLCVAPFAYDGDVREAAHRFKFHGRLSFQRMMGTLMARTVQGQLAGVPFDLVCAVPLSKERLRQRGYNQAALLAEEIASSLHLPYAEVLQKLKNNQEQHNLSREERLTNVLGVYCCSRPQAVQGKSVLLCDDIVTTGSTLRECARILLESGAKAVCAVCFAAA